MDVEKSDNAPECHRHPYHHHRTSSNELRERKVTFDSSQTTNFTTPTINGGTPNFISRIPLSPPTMIPTIQLPNTGTQQKLRDGNGNAPVVGGRKFSFPAALHANLLGLAGRYSDGNDSQKLSVPGAHDLTRRRFSNVSDAVSRKLSTTIIGWRVGGVGGLGAAPIPTEEVVAQGRVLCGQYIRNRLRRSGFYGRKLGLYRLRSTIGSSCTLIVRDVFPSLVAVCSELERMYPKLYTNIARQAGRATPSADRASTAALLAAIGHHLLHGTADEVTWGRVAAVYAIAGGLAVDCVCQGRVDLLQGLMEGMGEVLEGDSMAEWIAHNGGWPALSHQCKFPETDVTYREYATIIVVAAVTLFIVYVIIRLFFKIGLF